MSVVFGLFCFWLGCVLFFALILQFFGCRFWSCVPVWMDVLLWLVCRLVVCRFQTVVLGLVGWEFL